MPEPTERAPDDGSGALDRCGRSQHSSRQQSLVPLQLRSSAKSDANALALGPSPARSPRVRLTPPTLMPERDKHPTSREESGHAMRKSGRPRAEPRRALGERASAAARREIRNGAPPPATNHEVMHSNTMHAGQVHSRRKRTSAGERRETSCPLTTELPWKITAHRTPPTSQLVRRVVTFSLKPPGEPSDAMLNANLRSAQCSL